MSRKPARRLVVADDDPDILRLLVLRLRMRGYRVTAAIDGEQALYAVRTLLPDAVVLDWIMPLLQGAEVCARLKRDPQTAGIPVVLLTARASEADVAGAFEAGADDYLTKPFDLDELELVLAGLIDRNKSAATL